MLIRMNSMTVNNMNVFTTESSDSPPARIAADLIYFPFPSARSYVIPNETITNTEVITSDFPLNIPAWTFNSPIGSPGTIQSNGAAGFMYLVGNNNVIVSPSSSSTFTFEPVPNAANTYTIQSNGLYLTVDQFSSDGLIITTSDSSRARSFIIATR